MGLRIRIPQPNSSTALYSAKTDAQAYRGFSVGLRPVVREVVGQGGKDDLGIGRLEAVTCAHQGLRMANTGRKGSTATKKVVQTVHKRTQGIAQVTGQGSGVPDMKAHAHHGMFLEIPTYTGKLHAGFDTVFGEVAGCADTGQHEQLR